MKSNSSAIVANLLLALLALLTAVSSVGALPAPVPAPQGCNAGTGNTNLGGDQVNQAGGDQEVLLSSNKLCILRKRSRGGRNSNYNQGGDQVNQASGDQTVTLSGNTIKLLNLGEC